MCVKQERRVEERETEEDRDRPRLDSGRAPIFKEKVGFLFLHRYCWFWFSESLKVKSSLDTGLPSDPRLANPGDSDCSGGPRRRFVNQEIVFCVQA